LLAVAFYRAAARLPRLLGDPPSIAIVSAEEEVPRRRKAASKTKYNCPACELNAWAKPGVNLVCVDCEEAMEPEQPSAAPLDGGGCPGYRPRR
jgi:hypothetical protein